VPAGGPVWHVHGGQCLLQPLDGVVRLRSGFWGARQAQNNAVSIPHGIAMLEESGALWNLRLAAGRAQGQYRLPLYRDANVYVVLEAIAWDRRHKRVDAYDEFFKATTELLAAAQADDGYLNSYVQVCHPDSRFADPDHGHEVFCAGHLIQAAVADERTGGDGALMKVARRFADYLCNSLPTDVVEGHPEAEMALVELYRTTGHTPYLDLAMDMIARRGQRTLGAGRYEPGYFQDDKPVRESRAIRGHAVRALYLAAGATDCYIETGDNSLFDAMAAQWEDMVSAKTYITGGLGSRHTGEAFGDQFELPSDRAYCETCASIAAIMWCWRMLLVTGNARYAALTERILYNAFAAAVDTDGTSYFYVNPLQSRGFHHRQPWYETACCPPNAMRLLASLEDYVSTSTDDGLQIHQILPCELDTLLNGQRFSLTLETNYPWDGTATLSVHDAPSSEVRVSVRVPEWTPRVSLELNGEPCEPELSTHGYATVERRWKPGDELRLRFPMKARVVEPNPAIDAVRSSLAIERGPLVYCIESNDFSDFPMATIRFPNNGLVGDEGVSSVGGEDVVTLTLNALTASEPGWSSWPYREIAEEVTASSQDPARLRVLAIPYLAWDRRGPREMRVWVPRFED
jgi:DUF1680 family protein